MHLKLSMVCAGGILACGFAAFSAQAAPANLSTGLMPSAGAASAVEKAAYRCRWYKGRRHCRHYGYRAYGYSGSRYREYGIPENYATGSGRWWQEMDRTDRGGRGGRR